MKGELSCAIGHLHRGTVVRYLTDGACPKLAQLAAVVREIYATDRAAWAYDTLPHGGPGTPSLVDGVVLADVILVAPRTIHVAQRIPWEPTHVLLSVGEWQSNVGVVVAAARERLIALRATR